MQKLSTKLIYLARKYLFHTKLRRSRLVARVYAFMFNLGAPDLTAPIVFRDVSLFVDPNDKSCVPSMVFGYFEEKELDIFEELIKQAGVFFDIGANIGAYSVIGCLQSDGLVAYAFEPVAENQRLLEKNIAAHQLEERMYVRPFAVSDKRGKARIHINESTTHSLDYDQLGSATREIDTVSLDEFTDEEQIGPDVMKIDVEGHEAAVIDGAWQMLSRYAPTLFMEFIPEAHKDVGALISRLRSLFSTGFVVDEISRTVVEVDLDELDRQRGCNLILTTNGRHAEVVRRFVAA